MAVKAGNDFLERAASGQGLVKEVKEKKATQGPGKNIVLWKFIRKVITSFTIFMQKSLNSFKESSTENVLDSYFRCRQDMERAYLLRSFFLLLIYLLIPIVMWVSVLTPQNLPKGSPARPGITIRKVEGY